MSNEIPMCDHEIDEFGNPDSYCVKCGFPVAAIDRIAELEDALNFALKSQYGEKWKDPAYLVHTHNLPHWVTVATKALK